MPKSRIRPTKNQDEDDDRFTLEELTGLPSKVSAFSKGKRAGNSVE
jgi:hypothetical protein